MSDFKKDWNILVGDCRERLKDLPDESVHMIWTSPPYFNLRDYDEEDQIGLEPTPEDFVEALAEVMRECKRVLRDDGTLWLNLGDSYDPKGNLRGIPWKVVFALQEDGWVLRKDIIWAKGLSGQENLRNTVIRSAINIGLSQDKALRLADDIDPYVGNVMPEPVKNRPVSSHEYLFFFSKGDSYFYDADAVRERHKLKYVQKRGSESFSSGTKTNDNSRKDRKQDFVKRYSGMPIGNPLGKTLRDVWCILTRSFKGAHFATAPEELVEMCVKLATSEQGCCPVCLSPFERYWVNEDSVRSGKIDVSNSEFEWKPPCTCETKVSDPCTVLDPFMGAATTLLVANKLGRKGIGIELNPEYVEISEKRLAEYTREVYDQWDDRYIPLESDAELPDELSVNDLFGNDE